MGRTTRKQRQSAFQDAVRRVAEAERARVASTPRYSRARRKGAEDFDGFAVLTDSSGRARQVIVLDVAPGAELLIPLESVDAYR